MKKILSLVIALCVVSTMTGNAFAENKVMKKYSITSVKQLKENIEKIDEKELKTGNTLQILADNTDPKVLDSFSKEKTNDMFEVLEDLGDIVLNYDETGIQSQTIDIGDGCWVKIETSTERISDEISGEGEIISTQHISDQSEYKEAVWKKYGTYRLTAQAKVLYLVAGAVIKLHVDYRLDEKGITIIGGTPANSSSGLMHVDNGGCEITDKYARTPGGSDVNTTALYQISYGYSPIEWSQTSAIYATIRYLGIDKSTGEIHLSERWSFKGRI